MGNRAVITASTSTTKGIGIYVHWNGGPESVQAFLDTCEQRGYRDPASDEGYAMARLCAVICEFFDGGLSVGIGTLDHMDCDNWDNGVYVIGAGWKVVGRWGKGSTPDHNEDLARKHPQYIAIINQLQTQGEPA